MKTKDIEVLKQKLIEIAEPMGIEVTDVEFKISKNPSLTVYIDTEDGVDLDTCEKYHNAIDPMLDDYDFTLGAAYTLNVSSPGLDRPLKTSRDFDKALGQDVEIKLFAPEKGKKFFEGLLTDYDENTFTVKIGNETKKFDKNKVAKVNIAVKFD